MLKRGVRWLAQESAMLACYVSLYTMAMVATITFMSTNNTRMVATITFMSTNNITTADVGLKLTWN